MRAVIKEMETVAVMKLYSIIIKLGIDTLRDIYRMDSINNAMTYGTTRSCLEVSSF